MRVLFRLCGCSVVGLLPNSNAVLCHLYALQSTALPLTMAVIPGLQLVLVGSRPRYLNTCTLCREDIAATLRTAEQGTAKHPSKAHLPATVTPMHRHPNTPGSAGSVGGAASSHTAPTTAGPVQSSFPRRAHSNPPHSRPPVAPFGTPSTPYDARTLFSHSSLTPLMQRHQLGQSQHTATPHATSSGGAAPGATGPWTSTAAGSSWSRLTLSYTQRLLLPRQVVEAPAANPGSAEAGKAPVIDGLEGLEAIQLRFSRDSRLSEVRKLLGTWPVGFLGE